MVFCICMCVRACVLLMCTHTQVYDCNEDEMMVRKKIALHTHNSVWYSEPANISCPFSSVFFSTCHRTMYVYTQIVNEFRWSHASVDQKAGFAIKLSLRMLNFLICFSSGNGLCDKKIDEPLTRAKSTFSIHLNYAFLQCANVANGIIIIIYTCVHVFVWLSWIIYMYWSLY